MRRGEEETCEAGPQDEGGEMDLDDIQLLIFEKTRHRDGPAFNVYGMDSESIKGFQDLTCRHEAVLVFQGESEAAGIGDNLLRSDENDGITARPQERFQASQVSSEDDSHGIVPADVPDGELRPIQAERAGPDEDGVEEGAHAVGMDEVARASDPMRVSGDGSDPAIERLGKMTERERPFFPPGVQGEKTKREVSLKQGKHFSGQSRAAAKSGANQPSDLDRGVRYLCDSLGQPASGIEFDGNQKGMGLGAQRRIQAHGWPPADAEQAILWKAARSLDASGQEEQGLPAAFRKSRYLIPRARDHFTPK